MSEKLPEIRQADAPSSAMMRLNQLLDRPDARERVQTLSSVALHRWIADLTLIDAAQLVELASPEQVREVMDLQVWDRDRVDLGELANWLQLICSLEDEARQERIMGLDVELVAFLVRSMTRIYLKQEDEVPSEPQGIYYETPDRWFVIDLIVDNPADAQQLVDILETIYQDDPDLIRRWEAQLGAWGPTLVDDDGEVAIAYGVYGPPETFFIDRNGVIVEKIIGPVSAQRMEEIVGRLLS